MDMTPEQELDLRMAEPEMGTVIKIRAQFPEAPKVYTYAAVGIDGSWYLSGIDSKFRKTWDDTITWFKTRNIEVISIQQATSWEDTL